MLTLQSQVNLFSREWECGTDSTNEQLKECAQTHPFQPMFSSLPSANPKTGVRFPADLQLQLRSLSQIGKKKKKKKLKNCFSEPREKEKYRRLQHINCSYWLAPSSPTSVITENQGSLKCTLHTDSA